ncbi:MAG: hypothetical protein JWO36_7016 [Myxococcales bacterium]|nr:hypothetical protein [Myxococcales bacterium]
MSKVRHTSFAIALVVACASQLTCKVNPYCLDCERGDANHGSNDGGPFDGNTSDVIDAGCIPSGPEICDGKDNDCNGIVDDGVPGVGIACQNQMGECSGGVQQCVAGVLTCTKNPAPEICDGKDNDCNGLYDEGDPGGGGMCGSGVGECRKGFNRCVSGVIQCMGAVGPSTEICDIKDNDCDGMFDEGLTNLGACGVSNVGECKLGTLMCMGGSTTCVGAVDPVFEVCNTKDDDCNGVADNGYDLNTDSQNCGSCGHICGTGLANAGEANWGCSAGSCIVMSCKAGYHDNNGLASDGCEFGQCFTTGVEVCDGVDNDCDGTVDEQLGAPPAICATRGECAGSVAQCMAAQGWKCNYAATVSTDVDGNIVPETKCDNKDNDCNGIVDDHQPNLGQSCHDAGLGICQGTGAYACDSVTPDGPAVCMITTSGGMATPEQCNGQDDDCDGTVDENAPDAMVDVKNAANTLLFHIYTYEASRPDASATVGGTMSARSCSRPGVVPWSSVTETQAAAACTAAGKRLCTAAEWQLACEGNAATVYPYGNTYQPNACNGNDYDPNCTLPDNDVLEPTGSSYGCPMKPAQSVCVSAFGAFDMSGNLKEWTSTQVQPNAFNVRGGAFDTAAGGLACRFDFVSMDPTFSFANLGFRCCSDPP